MKYTIKKGRKAGEKLRFAINIMKNTKGGIPRTYVRRQNILIARQLEEKILLIAPDGNTVGQILDYLICTDQNDVYIEKKRVFESLYMEYK